MPKPAGLELEMMKLLSMKHFPLKPPRPKLTVQKMVDALKRLGTEAAVQAAFESLCTLKGQGLANTEPKIILKEEMTTATFEAWLTPLGRTELEKAIAS